MVEAKCTPADQQIVSIAQESWELLTVYGEIKPINLRAQVLDKLSHALPVLNRVFRSPDDDKRLSVGRWVDERTQVILTAPVSGDEFIEVETVTHDMFGRDSMGKRWEHILRINNGQIVPELATVFEFDHKLDRQGKTSRVFDHDLAIVRTSLDDLRETLFKSA